MIFCSVMQPIKCWFLIFICVGTFNNSNGTGPMIDKAHLKLEPTCGEMPQTIRKHGGNRISNSLPSSKRYPWVIKVIRTAKKRRYATNCWRVWRNHHIQAVNMILKPCIIQNSYLA